jgi:hypothetical protein
LLQRLLSASPDARLEIVRSEDKLIDADFYVLLSRLAEAALAARDRSSAESLADLQKNVLPESTFGRQLQEQSREVEAAVASLQAAGQELTREKLLEILLNAPNDTRLSALVSLARPGLDYSFFQLLTERIDRVRDDERARLVQLRERLLEMTRQIDQQMQARSIQARQLLDEMLQSDDIHEATGHNLAAIDDFFLRELNAAMEEARKQGNLEKIGKLQQVIETIQEASAPTPEIELIEKLLDAPDDAARREILETNRELVTSEFLDALANVRAQVEGSNENEFSEKLQLVHRQALRFAMEMKFKG